MSLIILNVDEVRRTLSASGGAFVVHDKEVDIVRFAINSGFADIVLDGQVALRVMYQRPGETEVRAQTLTYYDTDGLRNYYDWQLLSADLEHKGTITCALCILRTEGDVEEWHTTPYQIRVLDTIHADDSDEADETITPTVAQRVAILESMIQRVASGAPIVVASTSAMTDTAQIYVLSTDGQWYYHNGSAWVAGGEYGAVSTDTALTQSGIPADAKKVGDEITNLKDDFNTEASYIRYGEITVSDIEQGNTSNGRPIDSTVRLRTGRYKVKAGDVVSFTSGVNIKNIIWQMYDEQGVWKGETSGGWQTSGKKILDYNGYALFVFRRDSNNGTVTPSDYDAVATLGDEKINITTVKDELTQRIDAVEDTFDAVLETETIEPVNKVDPDKLTVGRYIYNGTMDASESYKTTDYISVKSGDLLRLYKRTANPAGGYVAERTTGERLALFNANKVYIGISGQYPISTTNGYTVGDGVGYVRVSYSASFDPICLTVNYSTDNWEDYFAPHTDSARLLRIEANEDANADNIIDCWGDSRTEMAIGTSYTDYLSALLGDAFIVANHGISGQGIGQIGLRYGSNEVYVTLENNTIPASGSATVTGVISSVGSREGYNLETADATRGTRCTLNGVSGMFVFQRNGTKSFSRDTEGSAISVKPKTRLIPIPYFNRRHMQIMWGGKNDFSYAWPYIESGIEDNYAAMVAMLPHNKYLILGETYSSDYAEGSTNRQRVDTINAYLAQKYPDNFINILSELVSKGLALEGITPTSQDETDIEGGFIPTSLMADGTHPNQYGREAIAKIIYAWMEDKQWI